MSVPDSQQYPSLGDYALIGDCHSAALISRAGSIDWCCLPRFDSDSVFGRLLDWEQGGYFEVRPDVHCTSKREYLPGTLMLVTHYRSRAGEARVVDFFAMREGGRHRPRRELVRMIEGVRGRMRFDVRILPRFDFGEVRPWIHRNGHGTHVAVGGNTGLLFLGDMNLVSAGEHALCAEVEVTRGERRHVAVQFVAPQALDSELAKPEEQAQLAAHYKETHAWWQAWAARLHYPPQAGTGVVRSAMVLKALTYAPTGAIVAAPTTSLPEKVGGQRNWDYRYSWVRDSVFTVRALSALGLEAEATAFGQFVMRSAAGNADDLQVIYAVDGKRRVQEFALEQLQGWRSSRPVRIGNAAAKQFQADIYGLILELSWRWSERDRGISDAGWRFLAELVERAIARWREPDRGIWEVRSRPRHFVHSKVMCWSAIARGIALAERQGLDAPLARWRRERDLLRATIERRGVDHRRGVFVRSFGTSELDASLLLLPSVQFVAYEDERMRRTAAAIHRELSADGMVVRYRSEDGLKGREGAFIACTFWLAECFARQGRKRDARQLFARAERCASDLGLFSEEYDPRQRELLGNYPQGLTHLSHISAALALNATAATRLGVPAHRSATGAGAGAASVLR